MILSTLTVMATIAFVIAWQTASTVVRPHRLPVRATPEAFGMDFETVTFQAQDRITLKGWWIPTEEGSRTIIICHGIGANKEQTLPLARFLHSHGFQVFLFDFRAHGESEGIYCTVGAREQEDLIAAVRAVQARGSGRIGVVGFSMGGATAILTAARCLDIEAVAADSTFCSMSRLVKESFTRRFHLPNWPIEPISVAIAYWRTAEDLRTVAPEEAIGQISPRPVLLIHGDADHIIPVEHSKRLFQKANDPKELKILPGVAHIAGSKEAQSQYEKDILEFFNRWLK